MGLQRLGAQRPGNGKILFPGTRKIVKSSLAAQQFHAHALPELLTGQQLHQTYLTGTQNMGAAAGAAVSTGEGHQPHQSGNEFLGTVFGLTQGITLQKTNVDGGVAPDEGVGLCLDGGQVIGRNIVVKVNGDNILAQMEAHIVAAVSGTDNAANDVFARVLLHMVEPPCPVNASGGGVANIQRLITGVNDDSFFFPHVDDLGIAQNTGVGRLTAPFGIKGRPVQYHLPAGLVLLAGQDGGGEFLQKRVAIV